jgi:dTDP-4-dehydrorhamnose 3,5-epimerase
MEFSPDAKRVFKLQSYHPTRPIDGVNIVTLARHHDDGGSVTELVRLSEGRPAGLGDFTVRQINYSEVAPGAIKAFHLHARQTDVWFVPPSDRMLLVLFDVRDGSATEGGRMRLMLGDGASRLVLIPPGVAHGVRNLGPATGCPAGDEEPHPPSLSSSPRRRRPGNPRAAGPRRWRPAPA